MSAVDERYLEKRKNIERFFTPENKIADSGKFVISPSHDFQLEVYRYSTGPKTWNYSRGIISRISNGEIVADIKRNYGAFWYTWIQHLNGQEYFLCGEDYQGYSVLNLLTGKYQMFFPEEGHKGLGFCWAAVYPSPDGLVLAVDGCYWASPYDLVLYDFREPEKLPYKEIARFEDITDSDGWIDNDTFVLKHEVFFRKDDGALCESLSEEEQNFIRREKLIDHRTEAVHLKRPPFQD